MQAKNQIEKAQIVISRQQRDPRWDAFVASNPAGQYEQTSAWAQAKSIEGWHPLRIFLLSSRMFYGGAQILYKKIPLTGKVAYLSKGPVFAPSSSPEIIQRFIGELNRLMRREHILYLFVQPPDSACHLEAWFQKAGSRAGFTEIAYTANSRIDLRADLKEIFTNMKRSNRRSIRRCEHEGVKFREGTREDISLFFGLMLESCRRQGTAPNPASEDFFRVLWDNLESSGGKLKLFFAEYKDTVFSGGMIIGFGNNAWTWKIGWSGHWPEIRPTQAMIWESIKWAKNADYRFYNFVGISRETAEGLLHGRPLNDVAKARDYYKLMFSGQVYLLPRGHIYCLNRPLAWIYEGFMSRVVARKRLRPLLNRIMKFIRN
jgi:lipid II:glycine glycyltransferase (peptidoglycan interpeptide bridge formation enzyme)